MKTNKLTTRQHSLKNFLEKHQEKGKWFTIDELCQANIGYELNTNPRVHDRCIALSQDIKQLNWATNVERYIPIIKRKDGACKLAENKEELLAFVKHEKEKVERTYQYANHLQSLIELDGTTPFINLADRVLEDKEIKPIDIYGRN